MDFVDGDTARRESAETSLSRSASVGGLLQRLRLLAGLTQEQLAERSAYSANYISKLERGLRVAPPEALDRLSDSLGLSAEERATLHAGMAAARAAHAGGADDARLAGPEPSALVGREVELGMLRAVLAGAGAPALLFTGEPGIGKTRLLAEAARLAERSQWRIVRGGVQRARAQGPYAPLTSALATSIERLAPDERARALRAAPWLDLLLPELRGRRARSTPRVAKQGSVSPATAPARHARDLPPEQQRRLLFAAVGHYLDAIADKSGVLLLLDDLQWATQDGLDLLTALFIGPDSAPQRRPIRLISAYRDTEALNDMPLGSFLADLARGGLAHVRPLAPLSAGESERLFTQVAAARDVTWSAPRATEIARRAGGLPFFLVSFAEDLARRDTALATPAEMAEIPWTITQVIRQRIAALPRPAQELIGVASAVGRRAPRALLAQVAGRPGDEVSRALEAAVAARLLDEDGSYGFIFTHDLIRETVEGDMLVGRRATLHRQIGAALERDPHAAAESLAFHFAASDEPTRAVRYLTRAGDEAEARVAHTAAASFYQQALDLLSPEERARDAAPIEEKLGLSLRCMGRFTAAVAMFERARARFEAAGDTEAVYRVRPRLMDARYHENLSHGGADTGEAGWRAPLRAMFATGRAMRRQGRASGDDAARHMGMRAEGAALLALDHVRAGIAALEAALPMEPAPDERQHVADVAVLLASGLLGVGAWERCERLCAQMAQVVESLGDPHALAAFRACHGAALHARGDRAGAAEYFARADALYSLGQPSTYSVNLVHVRAPSLLEDGEWESARAYLEGTLTAAQAMGALHAQRAALTHLAELDVLTGEPQRAIARLGDLAERDLRWGHACRLRATLAAAYLALGAPERAAALASAAVATARYTGAWAQGLGALRVRGMVESARGHRDLARRLFAEGIQRARAMPYPYAESQLRATASALDSRDRGGDA